MIGKVVIAQASAVKARVGGAEKFEVTQQQALLHTSDGQVRAIKLNLEEGQAPYAVGEYGLTDACLTVDKYGRVELARALTLAPLRAAGVARVAQ
jgi:hypothetical protein